MSAHARKQDLPFRDAGYNDRTVSNIGRYAQYKYYYLNPYLLTILCS